MDQRNKILAKNLVNVSVKVKPGEKVMVVGRGSATYGLVSQIIKEVAAAGGVPFSQLVNYTVLRAMQMSATEKQLEILADSELELMKQMDCYIAVTGVENAYELSDVPTEKSLLYNKIMHKVSAERVKNTRWVVLRYPNYAMAQSAKMSKEAFEDFFYNVCCLDYAKMDRAMDPLKALMEKTDRVRLTGVGTDISFSIKNVPVFKCAGDANIPDGEVYTAPVKYSVNGVITYNTPSVNDGYTYDNIRFVFKEGKIVEATCNNTEKLNKILDTDEGARYIGEFAIGVNPYITFPIMDTLFDEKIAGSIHFTPGSYCGDSNNGNMSAVHWDLVFIQTEQYGGGEIYFDDVLIRKNGRFVLKELEGLNPENLK